MNSTGETAADRWPFRSVAREWPAGIVLTWLLFMIYPTFQSGFALVDDHEIVSFLGPDHRIHTAELLPLVRDWAFEQNGRFRPAYYAFRILEAYVAGGSPARWHMDRFVLAGVSALVLYFALRILLVPLPAGVTALLFFSGSQNEIWITLGPNESYAIALVFSGFAWIAVQLQRRHWRPVALLPGFLLLFVAGFAKETFMPILPGTLVFIYGLLPRIVSGAGSLRTQLRAVDTLTLVVLIGGVGVHAALILVTLRTYGHQYSMQLTAGGVIAAIIPTLARYSKDTLWFIPVMAGAINVAPRTSRQWRQSSERRDVLNIIVLVAASVVLILLPQWVMYANSPWQPGRYLVPGNLFAIVCAAVGFYYLDKGTTHRPPVSIRAGVLALLIGVALFHGLRTHDEAVSQARSTQTFQAAIGRIIDLRKEHPALPMLFCSTQVFDREALVSVASFLAFNLPDEGRPFLNSYAWEEMATSAFDKSLAALLTQVSSTGDRTFAPIGDLQAADGQCVGVVFSGLTERCPCNYSVRLRDH